jgi:uncharacterized protein
MHFMHWMIDGHNLIPHVPGISLHDLDDEAALIEWLSTYTRKTQDEIELFFDKGNNGSLKPKRVNRIRITFVPSIRTADQAIIDRLQDLGGKAADYTVVSSDHVVQVNARAARAKVMESSAFVQRVQKKLSREVIPTTEIQGIPDEEIQWWVDFFEHRTK